MGKDYSYAQEQMEDDMRAYYSQNRAVLQAQSLSVGQLVVVHTEDEAWLRARIISVEDKKIKASSYLFWHSVKDFKCFVVFLLVFFRYTVNSQAWCTASIVSFPNLKYFSFLL